MPSILRICALLLATGGFLATGAKFAACVEPKDGERTADAVGMNLAAARKHAILMHQIYSATLHAMHEHYFHANRSVLPARAMEDVFAEVADEAGIESRWISVNTQAMSVHHEPRDEFEKQAAAEIARGKDSFESVKNGRYRRVGAIPLTGSCVNCHMGFTTNPSTTPRFAGLVISVPLDEK